MAEPIEDRTRAREDEIAQFAQAYTQATPLPVPTAAPPAAAPAGGMETWRIQGMPPPPSSLATDDLEAAPLVYWQDMIANYENGTIGVDDYAGAHRQRVHDEESPLLRSVRAATPPRGDVPTEPGAPREPVPEVFLEVTKRPRGALADIGAGAVRGPLVAVQETLEGLASLTELVTGQGTVTPHLPDVAGQGPTAPETGMGQFAQGLTQFLTVLIPTGAAIRGVSGAGRLAAGLMASPLADFFAFDAHDPRLSNLVEQYFPGLGGPITEYLQAKPGDTEMEGRLKNVLEGAAPGVPAAAIAALRALKFVKAGRGVLDVVRRSQSGAVEIPGPRGAETPPGAAVPPVVSGADDMATLAQKYAEAVIEARRGGPRTHVQVQAEAQALIDQGRVSMDTVQQILPGTTLNDAEAVAVVRVLADSGIRVRALARTALISGDPADVTQVMQQLYLHGQVDPKRIGVITEAGRTLSAMNDPTSGLNRFLLQFEEVLRDSTRSADAMGLVRALADMPDPESLAILAKQTAKPGFWDMFKEYYVNGLLWGPKTWMANFLGNTVTTLWSIPERQVAAWAGAFSGGGGVQQGEAFDLAHGIFGSVVDGWRLAREALRQGESQFTKQLDEYGHPSVLAADKLELPQRAISSETWELTGLPGQAVDFLGNIVRFPSRVLAGTDDFFKVINYQGQLRAVAGREARLHGAELGLRGRELSEFVAERQRQLMADPPGSIKRLAEQHALYQTFTQELGETGQLIQRLAATPAGKIVMPFVRTPTNIAKYTGERTPLMMLNSRFWREINGPDRAVADLAKAKVALGSATMAIAGLMAYEGLITGGGPKDAKVRESLMAQGWRPYSLKLGGQYYGYNRAEPVAMLLGLAADWTDAMTNATDTGLAQANEVGVALVTALAKNFTSRTFVKGLAETFAAITDPEREASRRTSSFMMSLLPASGLIRQVEQVMDPEMREARTMMDRFMAQIPGLSNDLPPQLDLWGDPIYLTGVYGPVGRSELKQDRVLFEVVKVGARAPDIPDSIDEDIALTAEERQYWGEQRGKMTGPGGRTLREQMEKTMDSASYARAGKDEKAYRLTQDIQAYQDAAKAKMIKKYDLHPSITKAARDRIEKAKTPEPIPTTPLLKSLTR